MIVGIQFALDTPTDWVDIDLKTTGAARLLWRNLPKKPLPVGGEIIDNNPGWFSAIVVDGVEFAGYDHIAVEPLTGNGIRVTAWIDDLDDEENNFPYAEVWEFYPHRADPKFGGQINTHQIKTLYLDRDGLSERDKAAFPMPCETSGGPVILKPWAQFVPPATALVIHGVWQPDTLWAQASATRRQRSWREW